MRGKLFMGAVIATLCSLAAFADDPATKPKVAAVGAEAPEFTLSDSKGNPVNLSDFKGRIVVLEWINHDCPIDTRVIDSKLISTVYDKFKDKVVWLAIDSTAAHTKADYDKTIEQFKLDLS